MRSVWPGVLILGFHSARGGMVSHTLVWTTVQLCGGLLETGYHNLEMDMEGVMYPVGYL